MGTDGLLDRGVGIDSGEVGVSALAILIEARAQIEKGWCQGDYEGDNRTCCMVGALNRGELIVYQRTSSFSWPEWSRARSMLKAAVGQSANGDFSLSDWNDIPGRTKGEVLNAFDMAIDLAGSYVPV